MLNCKDATRLCSSELERPLTWGETLSLRTHLMMCSGCTNYRRQIALLHQAMQTYAEGKAAANEPEPDALD